MEPLLHSSHGDETKVVHGLIHEEDIGLGVDHVDDVQVVRRLVHKKDICLGVVRVFILPATTTGHFSM